MTSECYFCLKFYLVCDEGWSLLPVNAAPEHQKCYKMLDRQKSSWAYGSCKFLDAYLPVPRTQSEVENLKTVLVEIGVDHDSALVIGAMKCDNFVAFCDPIRWRSQYEYPGTPDFNIDMHLIGGLNPDTSEDYVLLYGQDSDFTFGSDSGDANVNPVCQKAPLTGRKSALISHTGEVGSTRTLKSCPNICCRNTSHPL